MLKRVLLGAAFLLGQSACLISNDQPSPSSVVTDDSTSTTPPLVRPVQPGDSTSLWTQYGDPSILAANAENQGALELSSRRHGCNKFKFNKLGDVLADLGVNMARTNQDPPPNGTPSLLPLELVYKATPSFDCNTLVPNQLNPRDAMARAVKVSQPARYVYCSGRMTLGMPPYAARLAEATIPTTAGVTKLFDVLAAASVELASNNLSKATRCVDKNTGANSMLFNADNTCNPNGMACLQGYLPSDEQVNLCNRLVVGGTASPATNVTLSTGTVVSVPAVDALTAGKRVAAAAVLANALLCE
jgi:hypothetical protein